ncbi:MAG: hypothetical protein IT349_06535 [Candidatus Eisenbacteria bacterium]|nr:hypothetical protein [Candidatus Eisenbacteria bacterium]
MPGAGSGGGALAGTFVPQWPEITVSPNRPTEAVPVNPIITREMVPIPCHFVADPFLYRTEGKWYIFFEAYLVGYTRGVIAYAVSKDGYAWSWGGICLHEPFHQAFPYIFGHGGEHYMLQVGPGNIDVRLYRAVHFPDDWTLEAILLTGGGFSDPAILEWQDRLYLFVARNSSQDCELYCSNTLAWGWQHHPLSPIVDDDRSSARAGGRMFVYGGNQRMRYAQKSDVVYGEAVRAFAIDLLTPTGYVEHEVAESPVISRSGEGWNAEAMHTYSPWWDGTRWLIAVDGQRTGGEWSIGLYRTTDLSSTEEGTSTPGSAWPNPFAGETRLIFPPDGDETSMNRDGTSRITILSIDGRRVRYLRTQGGEAHWDGRDDAGQLVPNGLYLALAGHGPEARSVRLTKLR